MEKKLLKYIGFLLSLLLANTVFANSYHIDLPKDTNIDINAQLVQLEQLQNALTTADCQRESFLRQELYCVQNKLIQNIKNQSDFQPNQTMMPPIGPCPEMQVVELLGIPGFAATDELVICGAPDTLAFLIFIEEPGNISGTQMSVTFLPGMQYAGFESTHYGSGTISNLSPNPSAPKFLLEGITNGVYIGYIGVEATCDANVNAFEYMIDLDFDFIYEDTLVIFKDVDSLYIHYVLITLP